MRFTALVFLAAAAVGGGLRAMELRTNIDWPEFLSESDLQWSSLPRQWHEGAFMGNGLIGAMLYSPEGTGMGWRLGRTDVVDRRNRIPIGWFHLEFAAKPVSATMRLGLHDAEIEGEAVFAAGKLRWRTFTHADLPLIVVEIEADPGVAWSWNWRREEPLDPRKLYRKEEFAPHNPAAAEGAADGIVFCRQPLADGPEHTTAWKRVARAGGETIFATIVRSDQPEASLAEAKALLAPLGAESAVGLRASHREWWQRFYRQSFISLPDQRLQGFWWIQLYKLASATRADRPMLDLMGPWFRETPWPMIWWNLNAQLTYWPVYTANHLEIGESLLRTLDGNLENLTGNVPAEWRHDSAGIGRATTYDCRGGVGSEKGNLLWICHNYWLQTQYAGDAERRRTGLLPLLARAVGYHLHLLEEGEDGRLHLPPTHSPEYATAPDCNYDLALLRWGCRTLVEICREAGIEDPRLPEWRRVLDKLVDFPVGEDGWLIGRGVPLERAHRHFSHLMMFYPLHLVTWDQEEQRDLIRRSVNHWLEAPRDEHGQSGYTFTAAAAMYQRMGEPEAALRHLNTAVNRNIRPNTMYLEAGPCLETPMAAATVINDMLLQSWGGRIRVFPGIPGDWREASFHNLRAEGAFLVSASRREGRAQFIGIRAEQGGVCRLVCPFGDAVAQYQPTGREERLTGEAGRLVELALAAGESVLLRPAGSSGPAVIAPVGAYTANTGYHYGTPKPLPEQVFAFSPALPGVRFVRVELPGEKRTLSLAEVEVLAGGKNVALGTAASQSTTGFGSPAGRAVDGNCSGNWREGSVTHTALDQADPWWETDLGQAVGVDAVRIYNRTDAEPHRLKGFVLRLLDERREAVATRQATDR
jgi:hypothetical protein